MNLFRLNTWILLLKLLVLVSPSVIDKSTLEEKIDQIAEKVLTCKKMVGFSLGIVEGNETVLTKGYGYYNLERGFIVSPNTLFGIASMTKAFTAALLTKLIHEHSKYTLDTTVAQILGPGFQFSNCFLTKYATLRDLLAHRTGLSKYNDVRLQPSYDKDELARKVRFMHQVKEFRNSFIYNNNMYGLLAKITEVVGGDTWENLMRKHIFEPLGMSKSTFTHKVNLSRDDMAVAYTTDRWSDDLKPASQKLHQLWGVIGGTGSIVSTAEDMTQWMKFHLNKGIDSSGSQLMPPSVVEELHTTVATIPECSNCKYYRKPHINVSYILNGYALGWRTGYYRGNRMVSHTGSSYGYTGILSLLPDIDLGIHTSVAGPDYQYEGRRALHFFIMDLLLGETNEITTENVCTFPYHQGDPRQKPNSTFTPDFSITKPEAEKYVGMYGDFLFGNVTVVYNETTSRLQVQYGEIGLWDLYKLEGDHHFGGVGCDNVWQLSLDSVKFSDEDQEGRMTSVKILDFDTLNPPVLKRGLKESEAPKTKQCDETAPMVSEAVRSSVNIAFAVIYVFVQFCLIN